MAHRTIQHQEAIERQAFAELQRLKDAVNRSEAQFGPDDKRTKDLRKLQEEQFKLWNGIAENTKNEHDLELENLKKQYKYE